MPTIHARFPSLPFMLALMLTIPFFAHFLYYHSFFLVYCLSLIFLLFYTDHSCSRLYLPFLLTFYSYHACSLSVLTILACFLCLSFLLTFLTYHSLTFYSCHYCSLLCLPSLLTFCTCHSLLTFCTCHSCSLVYLSLRSLTISAQRGIKISSSIVLLQAMNVCTL